MPKESDRRRLVRLMTRAAVVVVFLALIGLACGEIDTGADVASDGDQTTDAPDTTKRTSEDTSEASDSTVDDGSDTESAAGQSAAELATEYWEALAAGDSEAALSMVDPDVVDTPGPNPWGWSSSLPLADIMPLWEAQEQQWELKGCVDVASKTADCTVTGSDVPTRALGVEPITGTFRIVVSDGGIFNATDHADSYIKQYSTQVWDPFMEWARANRSEEDFEFLIEPSGGNDETAQLYADILASFVEAREGS